MAVEIISFVNEGLGHSASMVDLGDLRGGCTAWTALQPTSANR